MVICGNKLDQENNRQVSSDEAYEFAVKNKALFFEASAKEDIDISKMFYTSIGNLSCFDDIRGNYKNLAYDIEYENNLSSTLDKSTVPQTPKGNDLDKFKIGPSSNESAIKRLKDCKC